MQELLCCLQSEPLSSCVHEADPVILILRDFTLTTVNYWDIIVKRYHVSGFRFSESDWRESVLYLVGELLEGDVQQVWDSGQEQFPAFRWPYDLIRQIRVQQWDQVLQTHIQHLNTHTREHTCLHHWSHSRILEMIIDSCVITGAHACSAILKPHSSPVRVHCCNADLDRENTVSQSWEKLNRKIKQWIKLLSYLSTPLHTWVSETHTNRGKHQHRHTTAHSHMIRKW